MEEYILYVDQKLSIIKMSIFLTLIYILVMQSQSNLSRVSVEFQKLILNSYGNAKSQK